ncbi:MAG: MBL fold metallo-hydrolase [Bacteroidetes bacterium]|jgi:glyoxylase-like metal-dependent hydrolase (beta-lactamase superfamily II)|nr:MBL fold metallo-hydrolase [Bacteroidota bacterium]
MIHIKSFTFNPFQENTYILYDDTSEAVIIDAGCCNEEEQQTLTGFLNDNNLKPVKLVNTHCHIDHILGIKYLATTYNIPFIANKNDYYLIAAAVDQGAMFGVDVALPPAISEYIDEDTPLTFGNSSLKVLYVPGHSIGHVAFYAEEEEFLISGDVLFSGSIGRTDLPGGDYDTLLASIREKLLPLPVGTIVYAGHGPPTTIGQETDTNPFLK